MAKGLRDVDRGWRGIMATIKALVVEKPRVVVGIVGGQHSKADMTIAELGAIHEFGAGVPKRSFIRDTLDKNAAKYARGLVAAGAQVTRKDKGAVVGALKRVGLQAEGDIKQRIADGIPPPNAASTIAAKGSSKPLIDSGQLRASITSQVRSGRKVVS